MEKRVRLGQLVWENKLDYTAIYLVRPRQQGGGRVYLARLVDGCSTTGIVRKIDDQRDVS